MKFNSIAFLLAILVGFVPVTWGQEQTTTKEQLAGGGLDTTQDNYGAYPKPDAGYVTDLANQLTDVQEEEIEQWLWQTESRTGVEIAVVTIPSIRDYETGFLNIESFATGLFDAYGIGNLPKNDGVLLVVARNDRKARIELGKFYGHDRDSNAISIMNNTIIPRFKEGDYSTGITDGVKAIMLEFADVRVGYNWMLIGILVLIPVLIVIAFNLFKAGKKGRAWAVIGIIIVIAVFVFKILLAILKALPEGDSDSWESGGSGGGFGGGSSGGGGATGSW